MKKIVFATNNAHKLEEVRAILQPEYSIVSLAELGCNDDIPETADTLAGNALLKAQYIYDKYGVDCFADDTGLEIEALNGEPGVYSARYAGEDCVAENNMKKVLTLMQNATNRKACFKTVIALIENGKVQYFEGRVDGIILTAPQGEKGFGYDPIFMPEGHDVSFAQMPSQQKNNISHRGLAIAQLTDYFKK